MLIAVLIPTCALVNADAKPCTPKQRPECVKKASDLCDGLGGMTARCMGDVANECASSQSCEDVDLNEPKRSSNYCFKDDPMVMTISSSMATNTMSSHPRYGRRSSRTRRVNCLFCMVIACSVVRTEMTEALLDRNLPLDHRMAWSCIGLAGHCRSLAMSRAVGDQRFESTDRSFAGLFNKMREALASLILSSQ